MGESHFEAPLFSSPTSKKGVQQHSTIVNNVKKEKTSTKTAEGPSWGRATAPSSLGSLVMLIAPPLMVNYFLISCTLYQCHLDGPPRSVWEAGLDINTLSTLFATWVPRPTWQSFYIWTGWLLFQALLQMVVPSDIGMGQETPAGRVLPYRVNGFRCYLISHALFLLGAYLDYWNLSVIAHHWSGLFVWANIGGYFMTLFCYVKAHLFPSHADDRKFSGSILYDIYMGIEFNPRIGDIFDFKLFFNGRPGIIAWTMITISFAAAQREVIGYITNSMYLVLALHALYVVDFFYNEDWYLRTIDIAHDHSKYTTSHRSSFCTDECFLQWASIYAGEISFGCL